jgi:hypothetical protein
MSRLSMRVTWTARRAVRGRSRRSLDGRRISDQSAGPTGLAGP